MEQRMKTARELLENQLDCLENANCVSIWDVPNDNKEITGMSLSIFTSKGVSTADIPKEIIKKYESVLRCLAAETVVYHKKEADKIINGLVKD